MRLIKQVFILSLFVGLSLSLNAQSPPHPNGGSGPNGSNTPVGGGAPISGGLIILAALGMGYVSRRVYDIRSRVIE